MLRSVKTLLKRTTVSSGCDLLPLQNAVCLQQIRGLRPRKPAYSGLAKTKRFRIFQDPDYPPDEVAEMRRLHNHHKLYIRSIRTFFQNENKSHAAGSKQADQMQEAEEAEWQESLIKIQEWNKEVARSRDERLLNEMKMKERMIEEKLLEEEAKRLKRIEEINEMIRREKELSKTYITPDNIDKAIEAALEDKRDHNFAIDVRGKKYEGRFVNAAGVEDLPDEDKAEEEAVPHLFQSSPIVSQSSPGK